MDGMRSRITAECCGWVKARFQIDYGASIEKK
jgi:hypothetical protein